MTTLMTFDLRTIYELASKFVLAWVVARILDLIVILLLLLICKLSSINYWENDQFSFFRTFLFWGIIIGWLAQT